MVKLFRFLNTLSFDTALGALVLTSLLGNSIAIAISPVVYIALFISVLIIYNFDHLLDALMLGEDAASYRHSYYQKNFLQLIYWQLLLVILGLVVIAYLPTQIFWAGIIMLLLMIIYFWFITHYSNHKLIYREIVVASGYALAIALAPMFSESAHLTLRFWWTFVIILFIALTNIWVYSIYEFDVDTKENRHSIARSIGVNLIHKLTHILMLVSLLMIGGYSFYFKAWLLGGILASMEITYLLLLENKQKFEKGELYRLVGEGVLVLPAISLIANEL